MRALAIIIGLCTTPAAAQIDPASLPPVSSARAVSLFEAICADSLPAFATVRDRLSANAFTHVADTGTVYSTQENASFKIADGPDGQDTCSMVFATKDDTETFVRAIFALGEFQNTQLGLAARYRNTLVIVGGQPTTVGDITYHNLRILSER